MYISFLTIVTENFKELHKNYLKKEFIPTKSQFIGLVYWVFVSKDPDILNLRIDFCGELHTLKQTKNLTTPIKNSNIRNINCSSFVPFGDNIILVFKINNVQKNHNLFFFHLFIFHCFKKN